MPSPGCRSRARRGPVIRGLRTRTRCEVFMHLGLALFFTIPIVELALGGAAARTASIRDGQGDIELPHVAFELPETLTLGDAAQHLGRLLHADT